MSETPESGDGVMRVEGEQCDACGRFGAFVFDGRKLCGDCYQTAGTCGPGGSESDEAATN